MDLQIYPLFQAVLINLKYSTQKKMPTNILLNDTAGICHSPLMNCIITVLFTWNYNYFFHQTMSFCKKLWVEAPDVQGLHFQHKIVYHKLVITKWCTVINLQVYYGSLKKRSNLLSSKWWNLPLKKKIKKKICLALFMSLSAGKRLVVFSSPLSDCQIMLNLELDCKDWVHNFLQTFMVAAISVMP